MKINAFFNRTTTLLAAIAIALLFTACTKESPTFAIVDAEKFVTEYNANQSEEDQADYLVGEVSIKAESEIGAVVYINNKELETPFFYLLRTNEQFDNFDINLEKAEVLFFHSHIIVNDLKENQSFLFKVGSHPLTEVTV